MGANKLRDGILLAVVALLALLLLLPDDEPVWKDNDPNQLSSSNNDAKTSANGDLKGKHSRLGKQEHLDGTTPVEGVLHRYFPLIPGSTWVYKVQGPERFVPNEIWTLELVSKPEGDEPGIAKVGFGEKREEAKFWIDGEAIRFDGLPLMEPVEFLGNRPMRASGALLPAAVQVGPDAVWTMEFERDVVYQFRDKRGKPHTTSAKAKEKARAIAKEPEPITTAAGHFRAWKISWISRIEISAKGRPVLQELTSEPFRRETMWVAPGIGVVRRRIDYSGYRGAQISFELMEFRHPSVQGQQ